MHMEFKKPFVVALAGGSVI